MFTIIDYFEESVKKYQNNPYLWDKRTGNYEPITYGQTYELVKKFAAGLIQLGIKKGDRLALLSEGRNEWVIAELGMLYIGAVNVPLSVKLAEPSEILFRLDHSGSRIIIVSQGQLKKIQTFISSSKTIEKRIQLKQ